MTKLITKEDIVINEIKRIIEESKRKVVSYEIPRYSLCIGT